MINYYFMVDCRDLDLEQKKEVAETLGEESPHHNLESATLIYLIEGTENTCCSDWDDEDFESRMGNKMFYWSDWKEVCSQSEHQPDEKVRWLT